LKNFQKQLDEEQTERHKSVPKKKKIVTLLRKENSIQRLYKSPQKESLSPERKPE